MSRGYLTNPNFQYTVTCQCPKSAGVCVGGDDGDTGQSEEASEEEVDAGDFKDGCLGAHNTHRADHSARPLTWCEKCAEFAQRHCDTLAARGDGRMTHSTRRSRIWDGKPHGENLAYMTGATCPMVVDYWYDEKDNYIRYKWNPVRNFRHGDFGHFTQEVWKSTTGVGCGQTGNYVCCVYEPSGNRLSTLQFRRNVET
ncbi:PREDICTED: protein PRY1-like [Branchiostoma belcheri]|uniref:Protein PRY1-like n=1 Tax=Branchiostoma belcheri TaxID=7741 RepID=A0A6P4Z4Q9_BRABE|nr:PREDICTED: protein PRY1-like [Branchiostoma belcheri]